MAAPKLYSAESIALVRREYEDTDEPVTAIARRHGLHPSTITSWARRYGWRMRSQRVIELPNEYRSGGLEAGAAAAAMPALPAAPSEGAAAPQGPPSPGPAGVADAGSMVERLQRAIEREMASAESILARLPPGRAGDAERAARTLASLARSLKQLKGLEPATADHDDAVPRDIDEFRGELARRIDALVASRTDPGPACETE